MRSTGEGISIAGSLKEALRKSFHVALKHKDGQSIIVSTLDGLESVAELADKAGINLVLEEDAEARLADQDTIAYYNPNVRIEDKRLRSLATRNRVITFTEKESLAAFLLALTVKDFTVHSIEEWHTMMQKDVSAL